MWLLWCSHLGGANDEEVYRFSLEEGSATVEHSNSSQIYNLKGIIHFRIK